jgi:hypothetical protein
LQQDQYGFNTKATVARAICASSISTKKTEFRSSNSLSTAKLIDEWLADQHVPTPTTVSDAHSSTCRMIRGVMLKSGGEIRLDGTADRGERAADDYFEVAPARDKRASN